MDCCTTSLFFETNGEFFGIWEQLKPVTPEFRKQFNDPYMLANMEKAAKRYEEWSEKRAPGSITAMREYMKQERAKTKSAKA